MRAGKTRDEISEPGRQDDQDRDGRRDAALQHAHPKDFNNLIGLDNDMARATFACIGVPVEFMTGSWSGLLPAVIAGQADVMWDDLYYMPERAEQADFVVYLRVATGGLVAKGNPKKIQSLADVCGARATAGLGTTEEAVFRDLSKKCVAGGKPEIKVVTFPDAPAGARLVKNDRADLLMIDLGLVNSFIAADPDSFSLAFTIRVVQFSMDFYDFDSEGDVESGAVAGVFDVVGS